MALKSTIESLLFISIRPLSIKQLQETLGASKADIVTALDELVAEYMSQPRGIAIQKNGDQYQMVTSPDSSAVVREFLKEELTGELTQPQLETATVIAYRAPVTKTEIEMIRGVNCTLILRNLLMRGLIEEKEDSQSGITLYTISFEFMRYLGISQLSDLPSYAELNADPDLKILISPEKKEETES